MKLYLDACCLCRPFDSHAVDRNRIEAEAVLTILRRIQSATWEMVGSDVLDEELDRVSTRDKFDAVKAYLTLASAHVCVGSEVADRASRLIEAGLSPFDALHLACAEAADCDVLLTTDDRFRKRAQSVNDLKLRVENPLSWLAEVIDADAGNDIE